MNITNKVFIVLTLLLSSLCLRAQRYSPKEAWPYIYKDFTHGVLLMNNGDLLEGEFNVPIPSKKLHYLKDGIIMETEISKITELRIGNLVYINAGGKLMQLRAQNDNGYVLELIDPDTDVLSRIDIGYGISSATASAHNISIMLENGINDLVNVRYESFTERRESGKPLPTQSLYYIMSKGKLILATKADVLRVSGVDKGKLNAFIKEKKIKWRDVGSLQNVVDFIAMEM